ncbi:hypothetical protein GF373_15040, partial [bacterium]|nr:hypothetical protein [bacterium]
MKKLLPILLVFIIGLAGGYVLHDFAFFPKQTAQGTGGDSSEQQDKPKTDRPTPQFEGPLSPYLYNQVLPDLAPAWFLIHGERMQQSRDNIQEVLNEKPVAEMLDDFT